LQIGGQLLHGFGVAKTIVLPACDAVFNCGLANTRIGQKFLRLCVWTCIHSEVGFDAGVPGIIIEAAEGDPGLVAHRSPPVKKRRGVRPDRMPQLGSVAHGNLEDLLRDQRCWHWRLERRGEEGGYATLLRVRGGG
jgi:hypothetical protein